MLFVLAIAFLLLFLSGIFQLFQALWELRVGSNRNAFVGKGMLGVGLIAISFLVPYLVMFMSSVQHVQQANLP
ncbi:hypothetical protein C7445_1169 [Alicyclobacillus sacchari]|uniref:Uncharacterized protein n=1 Tax=Alicyclobacillus sacchari TaxID=392010 RepID=A0A4R8LGQ9_9BACL|nr:hypothetical protein C7445_1169 [Alicyclobacillus sacchari]